MQGAQNESAIGEVHELTEKENEQPLYSSSASNDPPVVRKHLLNIDEDTSYITEISAAGAIGQDSFSSDDGMAALSPLISPIEQTPVRTSQVLPLFLSLGIKVSGEDENAVTIDVNFTNLPLCLSECSNYSFSVATVTHCCSILFFCAESLLSDAALSVEGNYSIALELKYHSFLPDAASQSSANMASPTHGGYACYTYIVVMLVFIQQPICM